GLRMEHNDVLKLGDFGKKRLKMRNCRCYLSFNLRNFFNGVINHLIKNNSPSTLTSLN
ncbi:hypothetical protein MKW98_003535, partial [Papaver atlanticum]